MAGLRVLLVRPVGEAEVDPNAADARALAAVGLAPIIDPYLQVTPVPEAGPAQRLLERLGEADWLVLTSARALPAWRSLVGARALDAALDRAARTRLRVAAVGTATVASLPRGLSPGLVARRPGAASLLEDLLARHPAPARAALPGSTIARPTLTDGLRSAGWKVDAVAVYDTRPVPTRPASAAALAAGDVDAVVLRSPSAVAAVARYAGRPGCAVVATVGPSTTAAAAALGWAPVLLTEPDPERVAAKLAARLASMPRTASPRHTTGTNPTTPQ